MNESEWLSATDPSTMLEFLRGSGRASHRKLRLLMAACCRRVVHTFDEEDDWGREEAIDVAECYADGLAGEEEGEDALGDLTDGNPVNLWEHCTNLAVADCTQESPDDADAIDCAVGAAEEARISAWEERDDRTEAAAQAELVRDVFGPLPFRPVAVAPAVPAGTLDGVHLAVLADALEEAGCADAALLEHLRGPGQHVRACWAVDAVLGKS
jgi:hypothetical protein